MNHIQTPGGIHMVIKGKPVAVAKSDKYYEQILEAIKAKATEDQILEILEADLRRMTKAVSLTPEIELKGGQLYYQGEVIAGVLGTRMSQMADEGFDMTAMVAFLQNLMENPSRRVVEHLYAFLEHGACPITEDGHFLVYKAVRGDFKDIHSGTFDNSVGQVVQIPRNRVDEDPDRTCSHGLHVCSFNYLPHFSHADGHVMVCKVNPRDVVAIPRDYNNTKMRVCRYEVIGEHEGYYKQEGDVLSATSVATDSDDSVFVVEVLSDGVWNKESSFDRLSEAAERMDELLDDDQFESIRIRNTVTGVVVDEQDNDNYDEDGSSSSMEEPSYSIWGIAASGAAFCLGTDYDSISDAAIDALDYDGYTQVEIRDDEGTVVKRIS